MLGARSVRKVRCSVRSVAQQSSVFAIPECDAGDSVTSAADYVPSRRGGWPQIWVPSESGRFAGGLESLTVSGDRMSPEWGGRRV